MTDTWYLEIEVVRDFIAMVAAHTIDVEQAQNYLMEHNYFLDLDEIKRCAYHYELELQREMEKTYNMVDGPFSYIVLP